MKTEILNIMNKATENQRWLLSQALLLNNQEVDHLMAFNLDDKHTLYDLAENLLHISLEGLQFNETQQNWVFNNLHNIKTNWQNKIPNFS